VDIILCALSLLENLEQNKMDMISAATLLVPLAMERLMGMLLIALAVQMLLEGSSAYLAEVL
jgi:hypothetical protein